MIMSMPTTARLQHRYDHRLRNLVQRTGNVAIATSHGVPRSTARGWLGKAPKVVVSLDVTGRVLRRRTQQRASAFSVSRTDAGRDVVRDRGHRAGRPDVTCGGRAPETRESQPLGVMRDMPVSRRGCVTIESCPGFRPRERHGPERLEAKSENGGPRVARAR
jgi:hypothetical protein